MQNRPWRIHVLQPTALTLQFVGNEEEQQSLSLLLNEVMVFFICSPELVFTHQQY